MANAHKTKASDKQALLKKVLAALKKHYKVSAPKAERPVLESMLYAICLEDLGLAEASACYERILTDFHDLNEVRVSSISELEPLFDDVPDADWKAFRIRTVLQYVFEKNFDYEFEGLKKKTLELASKQLTKVKSLSSFVREYTLHAALGAHVLPVDESMARAVIWLGLADPGMTSEAVSESLKPIVRKADADQFSVLIRSLATDPALRDAFDPALNPPPEEGHDAGTAVVRLSELLAAGSSRTKAAKSSAKSNDKGKKKATKKAVAKRASGKNAAPTKKTRKSKASSAK